VALAEQAKKQNRNHNNRLRRNMGSPVSRE
jgi:hypothetical protein